MPTKNGPKVDRFYHSTKWKKCRNAFYASKKGVCEVCGHAGYIVHHRIPLTEENVDIPNISLNFSNLELLCVDCHNTVHGDIDSGRTEKPTIVEFDRMGNVIIHDKKEKEAK